MKFWQEHTQLRTVLIAALFIAGLALVFIGWSMTSSMTGLCLMMVGLALLLAALYLYNKPFSDEKKKSTKGRTPQ